MINMGRHEELLKFSLAFSLSNNNIETTVAKSEIDR